MEKGGTRKIYFYFVKLIIQENERLTELGIGLHKQGRVIDRLLKQRLKTRMDHIYRRSLTEIHSLSVMTPWTW